MAGDWGVPVAVGVMLASTMILLMFIGKGGNGQIALCRDIADISITYTFTFIGILLTFYSLLQVLGDRRWVKERNVSSSPYWFEFTENLVRLIKLLSILFVIAVVYVAFDCIFISVEHPDRIALNSYAWFGNLLEKIPYMVIVIMCFLIGTTIGRIYKTAKTFIHIIAANAQ